MSRNNINEDVASRDYGSVTPPTFRKQYAVLSACMTHCVVIFRLPLPPGLDKAGQSRSESRHDLHESSECAGVKARVSLDVIDLD